MLKYPRTLDLNALILRKSHFLFGARGVGKSTLIEETFKDAHIFDLLDDETFDRLLRKPKFIEEVVGNSNKLIIIDEIQLLPKLLNEVQRLMRKVPNRFLLTGSSARKLKQGSANLLGGRAWQADLYPLTSQEITNFNLLRYLNFGGLPHIYLSSNPQDELKAYAALYLKEEILAEALTRNLEYFVRFLDVLALQNGEELFYQGLSNESGVPARTIQNYVQILNDTLVGLELRPYLKSKIRKPITRSKFYFFDVGVANYLAKAGEIKEGSQLFGKAFEHFIVREVASLLSYKGFDLELCYWRSTSQFEVDLVLGNQYAIEIKSTHEASPAMAKGLKALREEKQIKNYCLVSNDQHDRTVDGIQYLHWKSFLNKLQLV